MGGGVTISVSPAIIAPKIHYFIVKGSAPWYSSYWKDKKLVTNVDESVSGQATVTCEAITDMYYMFFNLSNLTSIDLSNFDTSNVTVMQSMFAFCPNLTTIDLSGFDTSKVTNMSFMFYNCSNLTTIKGTIDMEHCGSYHNMFDGCTKLKDVNIINPPADLSDAKLSPSQYTIAS